jgi:thiosulfate dehydrogenase
MLLWSQQTTNSRSGADTWRCVECHGWDYRGSQGAYATGTHQTGFPGILDAAERMSQDQLVEVLKGGSNPDHDFSAYLDDDSLAQLALFMDTALIDTTQFIDATTHKVIGGDINHGQQFFDTTCSPCHGLDGRKIVFRYEGVNASLGTLANTDPWRFLHKTRYGTPGTAMVVGHDIGWTEEDGRDVLLYAQGFPTGGEAQVPTPVIGPEGPQQPEQRGGPASNLLTGILTAIGAMFASIGFAVLLLGVLVGVILLMVYVISKRNQ